MPNKPSFIEWMRGKRTNDINLPNESGSVDASINSPERIIQGIEENPSLKALRAYGEAAMKREQEKKK